MVELGDWRTNQRLLLYDQVAKREVGKYNISVIPAFQSTLAFFDKLCDIAHYPFHVKLSILTSLAYEISMKLVKKAQDEAAAVAAAQAAAVPSATTPDALPLTATTAAATAA